MVEIDTLFQTKTAGKKNIPAAHTHIAYIRDSPLGGENAFENFESRCLRKGD